MATFESSLIGKKTKHRGLYSGKEYDVEGVIKLTNGQVLAANDILLAAPLGENQVVTKVRAYALGATGPVAVSLGYFQILENGQPLVIERYGPLEEGDEGRFTSPASDGDAFAAAAVLSTARQVIVAAPAKLAGPVHFGALVTTGGTLAADVEIHLSATVVGELSDTVVNALYPNAGYEPNQL
ncbi:hypothetical protein [Xanthomonas phage DES1]|nr:hypothetical protein [Xanthomonas phage DES1]